ncbi:hypothetical protein [Streptomyces sp. NPDC094032]|uniref:hypothetical protein n=1 Tax=Streptomyces sp. NPDC094032 TaxID=3155308 RepID=UPI003321AF42
MSAIQTVARDGIDHGSTRGYYQHRARKVLPSCQPCRDAYNAANRAKRAEAQRWNRGLVGPPAPPRPVPTGRECPADGCGELTSMPQPSTGMVAVSWPGSREPDRWYCAGACATYGRALAEVRAIEVGRG